MLFNSYIFIFLFLPITLIGYFQIAKTSHRAASAWLTMASFLFYGWWSPRYLALMLASILFNYAAGIALVRSQGTSRGRALLFIALAVNLGLLGYYKYTNFFLESANALFGTDMHVSAIILPLGISFFTFTQIAFLVDAYQGKAREYSLVHYALFVSYFPHLIAGPILHHREMMPQFAESRTYYPDSGNFAVGLTIFAIGLFKKVVIADGIGVYARPVFDVAAAGVPLTFLEAWTGALCYSFQLYFDFSGYSDMAIGLSRLFGVKLPLNFHSPYKAWNIIEFWRRWHMTLSRFLRDYLYIPLGGNRKGLARRCLNVMITMLLGGLWHGAGWTFVIWGGLHGAFLGINYAWHYVRRRFAIGPEQPTPGGRAIGCVLTFLAVTIAWVFFRSTNLEAAMVMLKGMAGLNGLLIPDYWMSRLGSLGRLISEAGVPFGDTRGLVTYRSVGWLALLWLVVWTFPNTQQLMRRYEPALDMPSEGGKTYQRIAWSPNRGWAIAYGVVFALALTMIVGESEFLYFQF
jgi:D-alanyl-lipoteichoic acid acyltransferase DltB (MBOAT superfamily)